MQPIEIKLHQQSHLLEIHFDDDSTYQLPYEFLRVYSPSAEVTGHGGQGTLQLEKKHVGIRQITPVGTYAMQIEFDDEHDSGIYTWEYLQNLGKNHATLWQDYLTRLNEEGGKRE